MRTTFLRSLSLEIPWLLSSISPLFLSLGSTEHVNLDEIQDVRERRQIESMINNFGQTPTKLFYV